MAGAEDDWPTRMEGADGPHGGPGGFAAWPFCCFGFVGTNQLRIHTGLLDCCSTDCAGAFETPGTTTGLKDKSHFHYQSSPTTSGSNQNRPQQLHLTATL